MSTVDKLKKIFPCRDKIINELFNLIGNPNENYPDAIFIYGDMSTGKTSLLRKFLGNSGSKYVLINLIECYTNKIFYETILNELKYTVEERTNFHDKCDNMQDFIWELRKLKTDFSYTLCLDNSERLRDMDTNILSAFIRLQELTSLNICCVLLSQISLEKYYLKTGLTEIIKINIPQYTKKEIQKIMLSDFNIVKSTVKNKIWKNVNVESYKFLNEKLFQNINESFYDNYLNAFLSVFYRSCRDLNELKLVSRNVFEQYCMPVLNGEIHHDDVTKLWRHIANPLKTALATVYTRHENFVDVQMSEEDGVKNIIRSLELPFYAKYLLIAGFLASHNTPKDDKKLFVKQSGRQKKRLQTMNTNAKVSEKMLASLGPKSFSIDRLLAIFYSILEEKVGLTCNLLVQISTLVQLKFFIYTSGENNIMEGSARLQCIVSLDFIAHIGKIVGFNVKQYLSDFM